MSTHTAVVIQQTKHWLQEIVIRLNLCPFAATVFDADKIGYQVIDGTDTKHHLQKLAACFSELDNTGSIETCLLIYPEAYPDFDNYLDFLDLGNLLLEDLNYAGDYQLASFHPHYAFEGSEKNDAANYSNRSPYPMLHVLRESSIEKAVTHYKNCEEIPDRNVEVLSKIGYKEMQKKLKEITG